LTESPPALDLERRHEIRLLFITAAVYVAAAGVLEVATLNSDPGRGRIAGSVMIVLAIAARYIGWSRLPFSASVRTDLPYLLSGVVLIVLLGLTLGDRVALFFYLASFEGCSALLDRRWAVGWSAGIMALSSLVAFRVQGGLPDGQTLLQDGLVYALNLVVTELLIRQESQRTRVERLLTELDAAYRRLRDYTSQAEALAVAQERTRLAREIHDTLGHSLTALDVQLNLLARLPDDAHGARHEAAARSRELVRDGLGELRRAVQALRPGALETFSLPDALAALLRDFEATTGLSTTAAIEEVTITPVVALALYRATQEALTNVSRHAGARCVRVRLASEEDWVTLTVQDDGQATQAPYGFGLRGLDERAAALGGTLVAVPLETGGFRLTMTLPR
jgi:signal transduction histidine kinase